MKTKKTKLFSVLCVLALCVAVGLTVTMAKYFTTGSGSDSASVAKFGVTVTVNSTLGLFNKEYSNEQDKLIAKATANIVAPGTSGELANVTISGTPEVNVKVSYTVAVEFGNNWTLENSTEYMPLIITVGGTEYKLADYDNIDALESAIATEVSSEYAAGTTLTNLSDLVSWEWPFESGADANDTYLSNKTTDLPSLSVEVTATVEQIQTLTA